MKREREKTEEGEREKKIRNYQEIFNDNDDDEE